MTGNLLLIAASVLLGWAALFPLRAPLGAVAYHLAAMPVGLLAWVVAGAVSTILGMPMGWPATLAGLTLFVGAMIGAGRLVAPVGKDSPPAPSPASFAVAACAVLVPAVALSASKLTIAAYDSFMHYHASGVWMRDVGSLSPVIMGERGSLLPSFHAAARLLGADWTYAVYPMMALHLLALLALATWESTRRLDSAPRIGVTVAAPLLLAAMPSFWFHSFFVHSHMITATYLLLAVHSLTNVARSTTPAGESAWAMLAGTAAAGVSLARPDGPAYLLVPLVVLVILSLEGRVAARSAAAFFPPVALLAVGPLVSALVVNGFWDSDKLSAKMAVAVFSAEGLLAAVGLALAVLLWRDNRFGAFRSGWLRVAVLANAGILAVAAFRFSEEFLKAIRPMLANLMSAGNYGFLWYFALLVTLMILLLGRSASSGGTTRIVLYSAGQFFAIALAVHAFTHPGRIHWGDSFNRVSFHAAPLVFWLAALLAATLLQSPGKGERDTAS